MSDFSHQRASFASKKKLMILIGSKFFEVSDMGYKRLINLCLPLNPGSYHCCDEVFLSKELCLIAKQGVTILSYIDGSRAVVM